MYLLLGFSERQRLLAHSQNLAAMLGNAYGEISNLAFSGLVLTGCIGLQLPSTGLKVWSRDRRTDGCDHAQVEVSSRLERQVLLIKDARQDCKAVTTLMASENGGRGLPPTLP